MKTTLSYNTKFKNQIVTITEDLQTLIKKNKIKNGTLIAYSLHTTLGLTIQESIEPNLCQDIFDQLTQIVDDDGAKYHHTCSDNPHKICKTDDVNGPSHVRQLLTNQNIVLDVKDGKLNIGTFQDIAVLEFDGPRNNRQVLVKIIED